MSKEAAYDAAEDEDYEYEEDEIEEGLTAEETAKERAELSKYFKMFGLFVFVAAPVLAWSTYFLTNLHDGQKALHKAKFELIYQNDLGYVYLALFLLYLARLYLTINANAARAPTGLERPDQHVYTGNVMMAGEGAAGRFNRAQRAAYNMDESLPLYAIALILAGYVFGPVVLLPALLSFVGRITFGSTYKKSLKGRSAGFMMGMIAEVFTFGLVGVCAVKGIFGPKIPF